MSWWSAWWLRILGGGGATPDADPTGLTATFVSVNQIDLDWTDNATNESGYKIERKVDDGEFEQIAAIATPGLEEYSDLTVVEDTEYSYRVRAYRGSKNSDYSNTAVQDTIPLAPSTLAAQASATAPAAPTGLTITFNARNDIDIDWTDASSDEDGFVIEVNEDGAGFEVLTTVGPGVETYKDTVELDDRELTYRVGAFNSAGTSYSDEESIDTLPDAPEDLTATAISDTEIDLAWTEVSNVETSYSVEYREIGGAFAELDTTAADEESYSATGLTEATTYEFRVRGVNASGNGDYSNTASATTDAAPAAPSAPIALDLAFVSNSRIDLTWVDTANDELGFKVERSDNGGAFTEIASVATPNLQSYSDTTVAEDNEYVYRVRAYNAVGNSGYTTEETMTTLPAQATGLTATAVGDTQIQLAWTDNSSIEDGYNIYRAVGAGSEVFLVAVGASIVSYMDTDLTASTLYTYRVRPFSNLSGDGPYSSTASDTTASGENVTLITGHLDTTDYTVPAGEIHEIDGHVTSEVNVIVESGGTLRMRPGSFLQFTDVNEANFSFVTHGVDVSDIGLWFNGNAVWDALGTEKEPWIRAAGALSAGATSIPLASEPTGWLVGDEIIVTPTGSGDRQGELRVINGIAGSTISFTTPLAKAHPAWEDTYNDETYTAEVLNLTRDVRVEGTPTGRSHIMFHDHDGVGGVPQTIKYVQLRHLGVATPTTQQSGRYAIHLHRFIDDIAGTLLEGVVARDINNHTFVTHQTHGVTYERCIAHNHLGPAYWWDDVDPATGDKDGEFTETNDLLYDRCVSSDMYHNSTFPGFSDGAFVLLRGTNTQCLNCVSVGGESPSAGNGFAWSSNANKAPNVWIMDNNLSHNHRVGGTRVWQNSNSNHIINFFRTYGCPTFGISQGAYGTSGYFWFDSVAIGVGTGVGILSHSSPPDPTAHVQADGYSHRFERGLVKNFAVGFMAMRHRFGFGHPTLVKDIAFEDIGTRVFQADESPEIVSQATPGQYDFVDCTLDGNPLVPDDFEIVAAKPEHLTRVQNGSTAFQVDGNGTVTVISPFYTG